MLIVETIHKVRLAHRDGKVIREIACKLNLSRNTARSIIRSHITNPQYVCSEQPPPSCETDRPSPPEPLALRSTPVPGIKSDPVQDDPRLTDTTS